MNTTAIGGCAVSVLIVLPHQSWLTVEVILNLLTAASEDFPLFKLLHFNYPVFYPETKRFFFKTDIDST